MTYYVSHVTLNPIYSLTVVDAVNYMLFHELQMCHRVSCSKQSLSSYFYFAR